MGPLVINYVVFFPLLLPILEERPLLETDLWPGPYPVVYAEEQIQLQRQALDLACRELRLTICRELRETNLESAFDMILAHLRRETQPGMIAGVLEQLSMCPFRTAEMPALVAPYLDHESEDVRYWAAECYGRLEADMKPLIEMVAADASASVRSVAAERLAERHEQVPLDIYRRFWEDEHPDVRAAMVLGACRRPDSVALSGAVREQIDSGPVALRFRLASALDTFPKTLRSSLVEPLSADGSASVRGALAAALGRTGEPEHVAILLRLCRDPDAETRRRAAIACGEFPSAKVLSVYLDMLGDARTLVRRAVEEALVAMHEQVPVTLAISERLRDPTPYVRYHVCRVLGRLGAADHEHAVHDLLKSEETDVNIAAAIYALGQFRTQAAVPAIAAHAGHSRVVVRAAVGEALGKLAVPATYRHLQVLAFDAEEEVRQAAIVGMGVTGDGGAFNGTILKVLRTVAEAAMSPENRGAAGRAAARLRPLDDTLMERLKVQATVPVVPGEMGEMLFEEDHVLATMIFTLATWAREHPKARDLFTEVHGIFSFVPSPNELPQPGVLMPSVEINEAARQAMACFENRPPETSRRPTSGRGFSYDASRRTGEN